MSFVGRKAEADGQDMPTGSRVHFTAPGAATGRRLGIYEMDLPANTKGASPHRHPFFTESFYVVEGELTVLAGTGTQRLGAGDFVFVPEHGVHAFRNDGDAAARFLILFTPGIDREAYFRELAELAGAGAAPAEIDAMALRHGQENLRDVPF